MELKSSRLIEKRRMLNLRNMDNKENNKETFSSRFGLLFLIVLAVFSVAFCVLLCLANREFRRSQDDIKQTYARHIQKADSLYLDMIGYNKNYISITSDYQVLGLLDSISQSLSSKNKQSQTETVYFIWRKKSLS